MAVLRTDLPAVLDYQRRLIAPRTADVTNGAGMKLLLAQDVAEILKIPLASVYDLARRKLIPCVRVGRLVRFEEDALRAWITTGGASMDPLERATTFCAPNQTQAMTRVR